MTAYRFEVDACDVEDKLALKVFRERRADWLGLFNDDPVHGLSFQVSAMLWNDAAYRVLNEARQFGTTENPIAANAPMLGEVLDLGFLAMQVLAIAKLTEKNPADKRKAVVSLRRVVDEMSSERHLFTREAFVCFDGLPYDWEKARSRDYAQNPPSTEPRWLPKEGPNAWAMSEIMHRLFDRLSSHQPNNRGRRDKINDQVFEKLSAMLESPVLNELGVLRHKLVAHAADQGNRPQTVGGKLLEKFAAAHRILTQLAFFTSSTLLLGPGPAGVPIPQFNQFELLDRVFAPNERLRELNNFWYAHANEREEWLRNANEAVLGN